MRFATFLRLLAFGLALSLCANDIQGAALSNIDLRSDKAYWFDQPVDHFGKSPSIWKQQYLVNATFYRPGGPIYITTPGENPASNSYTDQTHFTQLAKSTGGLLVNIEHRFFGKSNPMTNLSGSSLRFLTIENVLEDFAAFTRAAKYHPSSVFPTPVSSNSKIIFGGGSYAGNIAAWMRAKYPDLVLGAWASSAIVYARLLYYQFDLSFGRHLEALGCAKQFSQAVQQADVVLLSGNVSALADLQSQFGLPTGLSARDTAGLLAFLSTAYSMQAVSKTIDRVDQGVCAFFRDSSSTTPLQSYAASVKAVIESNRMTLDYLAQTGNSSYGIDDYTLGQIGRVWYYMECTWFGNWQVAPPPNTGLTGYRSQLVDQSYFEPNCKKKFGDNIPTPVNVQKYNDKWVRPLERSSNIYYTSGSLDIWQDATVATSSGNLISSTSKSPIVLIEGATHVQDLRTDRPDDLDSVIKARQIGDALVAKWLK
ncbi:hypothetical protein LPJ64_001056 [Coemansia asiatica]|uniref:Uncharacterized protein n=1 Tax=Coemansia asiatica TaxID=1052880 RepID=A0A9W8CKD0_9FUNG|nr:hypothetical protein LPJ64_001056 [Coemansia asiatica]